MQHNVAKWLIVPLLCLLAACSGSFVGPGAGQVASSSSVDKVMDAAMQASMPDVALRVASEQVDRNPKDAMALARQGDAYRALGRDAAAESSYGKALALAADNTRAQIGLGTLLLHRDPVRAEAAFRRVIAAQPQNPTALTGLGIARDLQGDHAQAQASYRAALALQSDLRAAQVDLGLSLALSGHSSDALGLLRPVADESRNDRRVRDNLAFALAASGRVEDARHILGEEMSDDDATRALAGYRQLY